KGPTLLVVPASLVSNWEAEVERFLPALDVFVAHPSRVPSETITAEALERRELVVTTWTMLQRLDALRSVRWGLAVLDEAQAIKNPDAQRSRAAHALVADARIAMTGTPIENDLGDLWSLFRFLCPGLLGTRSEYAQLIKSLRLASTLNYAPLRNLIQPWILRRLKSDPRIVDDLPDKVEVRSMCSLSRRQAALYQQAVDELAHVLETVEPTARRGVVLAFLTRFKQICNHPSLWTGEGDFSPED